MAITLIFNDIQFGRWGKKQQGHISLKTSQHSRPVLLFWFHSLLKLVIEKNDLQHIANYNHDS